MRYALIAAFLMASVAQASEPPPRFGAFPVVGVYEGRTASPVLDSEYARTYRTRIRDAARGMRPNFAGEFIVVTWGCGTSCEQITFINARTGQVIHPPISAIGGEAIFDIEKSDTYERVVSNVNSRLLLVKGKTAEDQEFDGYRYYTFDGQNLTHLRTIIVKPREEQPTSSTAEATSASPPAKAALPDECKWSKASRTDQTLRCPQDGTPVVPVENKGALPIPEFDVVHLCKSTAADETALRYCVKSEQQAYDHLKIVWSELSEKDKTYASRYAGNGVYAYTHISEMAGILLRQARDQREKQEPIEFHR